MTSFDSNFDYRLDSNGKDPDVASLTLIRDHIALWSKPLPSGSMFHLERDPKGYLVYKSELANYQLSSDTIINSWRRKSSLQDVLSEVPVEILDQFQRTGATAGARILFPRNRVGGKATINVARGFNRQINDRFDLTLECIRRQYEAKPNPLDLTLSRYSSFFELFGDFQSYVDFFLLNDLVKDGKIRFFIPFNGDFSSNPNPTTSQEYLEYARRSISFVSSRQLRMTELVLAQAK